MSSTRTPRKRATTPGVAKLKFAPSMACEGCGRPRQVCFCNQVQPQEHRMAVVILEHPQERTRWMNSASLARHLFADCTVKVGLSWSNLAAATGRSWKPSEWAVLYLKGVAGEQPVTLRDRNQQVISDISQIRGIIALDGNWQQAKTLWWRNPWLSKCVTLALNPAVASMRAQVKKDGMSTIEAVGFCLSELESRPELFELTQSLYAKWIIQPSRAQWAQEQNELKGRSG